LQESLKLELRSKAESLTSIRGGHGDRAARIDSLSSKICGFGVDLRDGENRLSNPGVHPCQILPSVDDLDGDTRVWVGKPPKGVSTSAGEA
jgi:hypothetical protein